MWKLLVVAAFVANLGGAQRSSYAPRPGSNYKLLARFRKNDTQSDLVPRGEQEETNSSSTTTLSPELQGTLEDHEFVHRVSQWPEERQPFWFKNRHAISKMRERNIDGGNAKERRPRPQQFQSSFQGTTGPRGNAVAQFIPEDSVYDFPLRRKHFNR